MAWQEEQRERCSGCGTFAWEWEHDADPYHVEGWVCHGCAKREAWAAQLRDEKGVHYGWRPILVKNKE